MKKGNIVQVINETFENQIKSVNEESFYDGHDFIEYGKNIGVFLGTPIPDHTIDKNSVIIKWNAKLDFRNSGIEDVHISVTSIQASLDNEQKQKVPMDFSKYKVNIVKEKNPNSQHMQLFVKEIEINADEQIVAIIFEI